MSLYLLTAPSGAGKTTFCAALAEQARAAGWDVAGVLSPPVFENGQKVAILAQNLRSGETRPLAITSHLSLPPSHFSLSPSHFSLSPSHFSLPTFNFPLGQWLFSPSALAWGNDLLASCLPTDLFIVDELGPLELIRGEGWVNALEALRSGRYKTGLVVIRPELVEKARQQLPINEVISLAK
jgi:nucleoside-triphosphatase THEP1